MMRKMEGYGIQGEFYIDGGGYAGQAIESNVLDHNKPPKTQPGLWNHWTPTDDLMGMEWNGSEKFYNYVEWLEYLITKVLAPRGYVLTGVVSYQGEDSSDFGQIHCAKNIVELCPGKRIYSKPKNKDSLLSDLAENFPGLIDGESEVNGSDLVEYMTQLIRESRPKSKKAKRS
jgi:hypothetical protein